MRAYTLALLSKLTADGKTMEDKDIVDWVNEKVQFFELALISEESKSLIKPLLH